MNVMIFIVWMLVGCVIAIPYTLLSGGNFGSFSITMLISPVVALYFYVISKTCAVVTRRPIWRTGIFWFILIWACMPVIFNLASVALAHFGLSMASGFIFEMRYVSLGLPFLIAFGVLVLVSIARGVVFIVKFLVNGQPET